MKIERREVGEHQLPATVPPLLQRIYAARGLRQAKQLSLELRDLPPPTGMAQLERAVTLLGDAVLEQRCIVVAGDYDADGATGVAVAVSGLRLLGARRVDYVVPNRMTMGYGLSPALVDQAHRCGAELILTVDNGVSSFAGIDHARALGIPVLVTDHHLPGDRLPDCVAMVNPNQQGCGIPSRHLAGVGVMFYLLTRLRAHLLAQGGFAGRPPPLAPLLDLVATGTVADLVRLDAVNRILVAQGLQRMRAGLARPGVAALLEVAGRDHRRVVAADLGFAVGPRINAAGRLDDIRLGIECLLTDDVSRAQVLAAELDRINRARRDLTTQMTGDAELLTEAMMAGGSLQAGLCVFHPDWHEGVVGLVASRLKDRHHRPCIAFAPGAGNGPEAGMLKGSARSIAGLHLRDLLAAIDVANPGLIHRFGGHAMAAGLSIPAARLAEFEAAFVAHCQAQLRPEDLRQRIETDGPLRAGELVMASAQQIEDGGPWGQGFAEPCFDDEFSVLDAREVGAEGGHAKYRLRSGAGVELSAIDFGGAGRLQTKGRIHAVYTPAINQWNGRQSLDLRLSWLTAA